MRKILIIISSVVVIILFGVVSSLSYDMGISYGVKNAEKIRSENIKDSIEIEKEIPTVNFKTAKNEISKIKINSSGRVLSYSNTTINSEVNGTILSNSKIKKGHYFQKGDLLFQIKDSDTRLLLESKKSNYINTISSILADIKLDYPDEYNKWEKYFNSLSYDIQIEELPKFNSTKEKNFIISRRIMTEFLSIKSDEERLKKYKFYAPFDGSITKSYIDISTNVNIGTPIIEIIRDGKKEVELNVNNKDRKLISVENLVTLSDDNEFEYNGFVSRIGNFVNPETQNISVFVEIPKKSIDGDLYNGMYLNAQIETYTEMKVCIIPRRSLISNNEIFILNENNSLEVKKINVITEQDNNIIVDNITDGERVIIEPLVNVKAGTKVNPVEL
tara:strand:+ start:6607 stop:7770 length:1164 start_codon:yes stop_codon:yes gene_type:complete